MYAETPKQFNKLTEQEIDIIIHMGVFSGNKTGFVRLGHISPLLRSYVTFSKSLRINGKNSVKFLCILKKLFNLEIKILCAHKPGFLMLGHIYY